MNEPLEVEGGVRRKALCVPVTRQWFWNVVFQPVPLNVPDVLEVGTSVFLFDHFELVPNERGDVKSVPVYLEEVKQ
jgi:hypothetical protein